MTTKLTRRGNSLAVRLPSKYLKQTNFKENDSIEISIEDGNLVLKPIHNKILRMTMKELTKGMTQEGVLEQYEDWGEMGAEIID